MSYDIRIVHPETGEELHTEKPHDLRGNTYCIGGTTELWLNLTYNYSPFYYRKETLGESTKVYGEKPVDGALPVLHEEYSGIDGLQYISIPQARERVFRAINALKDEDIDKHGKPYDMVTEYEPNTIKKLRRYAKVAKCSPNAQTRKRAQEWHDFYKSYYKRVLGVWAPTERNARNGLIKLLNLLMLAPDNAKIQVG